MDDLEARELFYSMLVNGSLAERDRAQKALGGEPSLSGLVEAGALIRGVFEKGARPETLEKAVWLMDSLPMDSFHQGFAEAAAQAVVSEGLQKPALLKYGVMMMGVAGRGGFSLSESSESLLKMAGDADASLRKGIEDMLRRSGKAKLGR